MRFITIYFDNLHDLEKEEKFGNQALDVEVKIEFMMSQIDFVISK